MRKICCAVYWIHNPVFAKGFFHYAGLAGILLRKEAVFREVLVKNLLYFPFNRDICLCNKVYFALVHDVELCPEIFHCNFAAFYCGFLYRNRLNHKFSAPAAISSIVFSCRWSEVSIIPTGSFPVKPALRAMCGKPPRFAGTVHKSIA